MESGNLKKRGKKEREKERIKKRKSKEKNQEKNQWSSVNILFMAFFHCYLLSMARISSEFDTYC